MEDWALAAIALIPSPISIPGGKARRAIVRFKSFREAIIDKCKQIFREPAGHLATPV
jgi:hypothetical protein